MRIFQILAYCWPLLLLVIGFFTGRIIRNAHEKRLAEDEANLSDIRLWTSGFNAETYDRAVRESQLVSGNVTLAHDVFRTFMNVVSNFFGRNLGSAEALCERGRREAIVRMKKAARDMGASDVLHVRMKGYSIVTKSGRSTGLEFLAYGTAIKNT